MVEPVSLYNTLTHRVEEVETIEPGVCRLYVCGISASGPPHVGHGRSYVIFDTLRRVLEHAGYEVRHVQNFTDIEESIAKRAEEAGVSPLEYAEQMIEAYFGAMDRLAVRRAHHYPRVTEYIERIVDATAQLVEQDCAYEIPDGIAFRGCEVESYGDLMGRDPADSIVFEVPQQAWRGRNDPFDFILWRNTNDLGVTWDTPWGEGRPGWHTECAVMATHLLGEAIDIHGGGQDLVFPHHESERAIARCITGAELARIWVHNGLLTMGREKMSKSLRNYVTLGDAIDKHGAACVRIEFLMAPHRETLEWRRKTLDEAHRVVDVLARGYREAATGEPSELVAAERAAIIEALRTDLDTMTAITRLTEFAEKRRDEPGARGLMHEVLDVLGLVTLKPFADAEATR